MLKYLFDWRIHVLAFVFTIAAELIGARPVGPIMHIAGAPIGFTIFPLLFALMIGLVLALFKCFSMKTMETSAPYIGLAVMWLIAQTASRVGPNIPVLIASGPAFILQEFGNIGTTFLSIPVAVLLLRMGREAIGAGFSIGREPSIAIITSKYGINSPEGRGVMGSYITGTVLGTLWFGIMASATVALNIFSHRALALASGNGSASMMAAAVAPIVDAFPQFEGEIVALAGTSNLLTMATGIYFNIFLAIPLTNWLYKILKGDQRYQKAVEKRAAKKGISAQEVQDAFNKKAELEAQQKAEYERERSARAAAAGPVSTADRWINRLKVLIFCGIATAFANYIFTAGALRGILHFISTGEYLNPANVVTPLMAIPGMLFLFIPVIIGCAIDDVLAPRLKKVKLPAILYISIIGTIMGVNGFPGFEVFIRETARIGLLPIATVTLAYAGISIGKDFKAFKEQGLGIVVVVLLAFTGTFFGSAIIAELVFRATGVV